jgi:hypothetical protein
MEPDGWPCTLGECRPGYFVSFGWGGAMLGFKSVYKVAETKHMEVYCDDGSFCWGGTNGNEGERRKLMVQPVDPAWEETDE